MVVVRYFGGTLLGVPGLINAYKTAAADAIKNAEIIEKTVNDIYAVQFDYLQMNDVMKILKEEDLRILSQQFDNSCVLKFEVRKKRTNLVVGKLEKIDNLKLEFIGEG